MSDDLCQCPICGRMHRHLGTPPKGIAMIRQQQGSAHQMLRSENPSEAAALAAYMRGRDYLVKPLNAAEIELIAVALELLAAATPTALVKQRARP